jgi:oligopeptidase B
LAAVAPVVVGWHAVAFPDAACECGLGDHLEFDLRNGALRLAYSSLVAPPSTFDYAVNSRTLTLVKQKGVPHYDPSLYATARLEVEASDGAHVPVSLVFHKRLLGDGAVRGDPTAVLKLPKPAPLHLYG